MREITCTPIFSLWRGGSHKRILVFTQLGSNGSSLRATRAHSAPEPASARPWRRPTRGPGPVRRQLCREPARPRRGVRRGRRHLARAAPAPGRGRRPGFGARPSRRRPALAGGGRPCASSGSEQGQLLADARGRRAGCQSRRRRPRGKALLHGVATAAEPALRTVAGRLAPANRRFDAGRRRSGSPRRRRRRSQGRRARSQRAISSVGSLRARGPGDRVLADLGYDAADGPPPEGHRHLYLHVLTVGQRESQGSHRRTRVVSSVFIKEDIYSVGSLLVQSVYLALNESVHDDIFWLPLEIWRLRPRGGRVGPRRAGHRRRRRGEQRRRGGERRARGRLADGLRTPRRGGRRRRGPAASCRRGSS